MTFKRKLAGAAVIFIPLIGLVARTLCWPSYSIRAAKRIRPHMSRAEVESLLGPPTYELTNSTGEVFTAWALWDGNAMMDFRDSKLITTNPMVLEFTAPDIWERTWRRFWYSCPPPAQPIWPPQNNAPN